MSMKRCIPELQGQNKLSRDQAERVRGLYDDLERDYSTKFGKQAAEAMASEEAAKRFEAEAALKRRQAALQATAQNQIAADVRKFAKDNPGAAAEALLASDDRAPYFNAEFRSKAIADEHFAMMNGILEKHSRNAVGHVRDVANLQDVVREAFGEHTGNENAKELAQAWLDSRFLVFKDADSWLKYSEKFGRPLSTLSNAIDPGAAIFDSMISHVHGMSRDIALMERLGPNPSATARWITDGLQIEANQTKHAGTRRIKKAKASAIRFNNMYQELTGGFDVENESLARWAEPNRTI
jgi:hypothetical protein